MKYCCFCLSLRTGSIVAATVYFIIVIFKILLLIFDKQLTQALQAVLVLKTFLVLLSGLLLLLGALRNEQVLIISFIAFNICCLLVEALSLLILYVGGAYKDVFPAYLVPIIVLEHVFYLYMVLIGVVLAQQMKEYHLAFVRANLPRSGVMSRAHHHSSHVHTLGI